MENVLEVLAIAHVIKMGLEFLCFVIVVAIGATLATMTDKGRKR